MDVLITGGAGFIGTNLARRLLREGDRVTILDNFSRAGSRDNAAWLAHQAGGRLTIHDADARDAAAVRNAVTGMDAVFHLAAQVAVTTSIDQPMEDFEINVVSTLNVLEAVRRRAPEAALVFTSTNKVYGRLEGLAVTEESQRYAHADGCEGVDESQPLDFHSPYGCSKGAADQYVRDYARVYDLRTVVFRMSCIYGPRQFGTEDQGWVAHFLHSAAQGRPITIYGDGRQVRDVLFVEDLVEAFLAAIGSIDRVRGEIFNIGGGPGHTLSLLELLAWIGDRLGQPVAWSRQPWRVGDQRVYITDVAKAAALLGWRPTTPVGDGLERLWDWVGEASPDFVSVGGRVR